MGGWGAFAEQGFPIELARRPSTRGYGTWTAPAESTRDLRLGEYPSENASISIPLLQKPAFSLGRLRSRACLAFFSFSSLRLGRLTQQTRGMRAGAILIPPRSYYLPIPTVIVHRARIIQPYSSPPGA